MENEKFEQPIEEMERIVKTTFKKLSERMKGRDLIFKNESGDERYYAILNPAGNIAIHSYDDGHDYLLWENGEIEIDDITNPEKIINKPTIQELNTIIQEIDSLKEEEIETPDNVDRK